MVFLSALMLAGCIFYKILLTCVEMARNELRSTTKLVTYQWYMEIYWVHS